MTRPKVSILIPCYNAAEWVALAVESALAQSWPEREVIVVNDGSTDGSAKILERFHDQIQFVSRENKGGNPTRNELLSLASGDWVQYLDADDCLKPHKIENQVREMNGNPDACVIYSPLTVESHSDAGASTELWDPHDPNGEHDPWAYHLGWDLTQTGGALFHRQALIDVGGWNENQSCCQDNELFFRLLKAGVVFHRCADAGAVYRRFSSGSVSTANKAKVVEEILRLVDEGEDYLLQRNELTARRRQAANQNRLALARSQWLTDKKGASRIVQRIQSSDPAFRPTSAPHSPLFYRIAYRTFGFRGAEYISEIKRKLTFQ